ncbi:MAG: hypothetical protein AABY86_12055, partial [Bdellovibrionota bacterium]
TITPLDVDGIPDPIVACDSIATSGPSDPSHDVITDTATHLVCSADRNVPGPSAYGRFCNCIREVTSSGTNDLYPKIGPARFAQLEEQAMKAAIAMKMNSLRRPLRNIARGLTYAAFNRSLRPTVAPMMSAEGAATTQPPARDGLACVPGNMGAYIEKLRTDGACNDRALRRLGQGMSVVQEPRNKFRRETGDRNFGDILDRAYTRTFSEGFGISDAEHLRSGFIQDARLLVGATPAPSEAGEPAESELPAEAATAEVTQTYEGDHQLGIILHNALLSMASGGAVNIPTSEYYRLKLNGLIAPYVMNDNEEVTSEKITEFLVKLKEAVKEPNGAIPAQGPFMAKFHRQFLRNELTKTLSDCEEKILTPIKETICPLIGENKFSITSLLGILNTPEERRDFNVLMNRTGGGPSSEAQSDQLLCYAYAAPETPMDDIFNYTNAAPVSEASVVFSIP